jgi:hypothetical protein
MLELFVDGFPSLFVSLYIYKVLSLFDNLVHLSFFGLLLKSMFLSSKKCVQNK